MLLDGLKGLGQRGLPQGYSITGDCSMVNPPAGDTSTQINVAGPNGFFQCMTDNQLSAMFPQVIAPDVLPPANYIPNQSGGGTYVAPSGSAIIVDPSTNAMTLVAAGTPGAVTSITVDSSGKSSAGGTAGGTTGGTANGASQDLMIGSFDVTKNWIYVAVAGLAAIAIAMKM